MFGLGFSEVLLIFAIALVVFGPKKLPELGKSIGRALAEFKKASEDFQETVRTEMKEVEKSTGLDAVKELAKIDLSVHEEPVAAKPAPEPILPEPVPVPEQKTEVTLAKEENAQQKSRLRKKQPLKKQRKIQPNKKPQKQKKIHVKKKGEAKRNA